MLPIPLPEASTPRSSGRKATQKSTHLSVDHLSTDISKQTKSSPSRLRPQPYDPVLTALSSIQNALSNMDKRLQESLRSPRESAHHQSVSYTILFGSSPTGDARQHIPNNGEPQLPAQENTRLRSSNSFTWSTFLSSSCSNHSSAEGSNPGR